MKPFFFGSSEKTLFGIYQPPQGSVTQRTGVVLCSGMGQEYIRGHRTFRQLAVRLARAGFPVLRFDYYGSGDSLGDSEDANLARWQQDIHDAIDETKRLSGVPQVSLIGLRLGASLSYLAGHEREDVENYVLWAPIVSGEKYIDELLRSHQDWFDSAIPKPSRHHSRNGVFEVLGFTFSDAFRSELAVLNLMEVEALRCGRVLLIENAHSATLDPFHEFMRRANSKIDYQKVAGARIWAKAQGMDKSIVPADILHTITTWMTEVSR